MTNQWTLARSSQSQISPKRWSRFAFNQTTVWRSKFFPISQRSWFAVKSWEGNCTEHTGHTLRCAPDQRKWTGGLPGVNTPFEIIHRMETQYLHHSGFFKFLRTYCIIRLGFRWHHLQLGRPTDGCRRRLFARRAAFLFLPRLIWSSRLICPAFRCRSNPQRAAGGACSHSASHTEHGATCGRAAPCEATCLHAHTRNCAKVTNWPSARQVFGRVESASLRANRRAWRLSSQAGLHKSLHQSPYGPQFLFCSGEFNNRNEAGFY